MHLEAKVCLDFIREHLSHAAVEVRENLHSELRINATLTDEIVERISESNSDAVFTTSKLYDFSKLLADI